MKTAYRFLFFAIVAVALQGKLSRKSDHVIDLSKTLPLATHRSCDGYTSPEEHPAVEAQFSRDGSDRFFLVSVYQKSACKVDVKGKCLDKQVEGWQDVWTVHNTDEIRTDMLSLRTCYTWGTSEPAEYVLSGWYQAGEENSKQSKKPKQAWVQAAIRKTSSTPDVYEFSDGQGGSAKLIFNIN